MTAFLSFVLFGFVFVYNNLFVLALSGNFAYRFESGRVARDLNSVFIRNKQNAEFYFVADLSVEFLKIDYVADCRFLLLASVFDDCVH